MTTADKIRRFYTWAEVQVILTCGKSTLWRLQRSPGFPKAINLPHTRRSVFVADEIDAYVERMIAQRSSAKFK